MNKLTTAAYLAVVTDGENAFKAGTPRASVPYPFGPESYVAWLTGWYRMQAAAARNEAISFSAEWFEG